MILPDSIRVRVEDALHETLGRPIRVLSGRALGGGCIHNALEVSTSDGPLFVKWNRGAAAAGFGSEARGLEALRSVTSLRSFICVPHVIAWHDAHDENDFGWLALEYRPPSAPASDFAVNLGRGLAHLHDEPIKGSGWGWHEDNRIGPLVQFNPRRTRWGTFWRDARLAPRVEATRIQGVLGSSDLKLLEQVLDQTESALADVDGDDASLLHGDLWSGNVHPGPDGRPVLVDPAAYHGHGEVDLAMAELFGGFPAQSLATYRELRAIGHRYDDLRRPLYQLYYLLAHLNLFGVEYLPSVRRAATKITKMTS